MTRRRLGELLVERNILTLAQLDKGLKIQAETGARLGDILIESGLVSETKLVDVLSENLGTPRVNLEAIGADSKATRMLRPKFCTKNGVFAFGIDESKGQKKQLLLAMYDPLNSAAIQEIEFTTGMGVTPRLAPLSHIHSAIQRAYGVVIQETPSGRHQMVDVMGALSDMKADATKMKNEMTMANDANANPTSQDFERMEQKLWALIRILGKRGLVSADEFAKELEE